MKLRLPKFDFSAIRSHCSPHRKFALRYNAGSTVPAPIERYQVKVKAKTLSLKQLAEAQACKLRAKNALKRSALRHILAFASSFYKPANPHELGGANEVREQFAVTA